MTSVHPPVVSYPLPRLPVPIEPAPELLSLARQSPVLQTALPGNTTGWLATGFQQVREVLADPRFSRALAARPGRELRGNELISATSLLGLDRRSTPDCASWSRARSPRGADGPCRAFG